MKNLLSFQSNARIPTEAFEKKIASLLHPLDETNQVIKVAQLITRVRNR